MRPSGDTARGLVFDDFVDKQVVGPTCERHFVPKWSGTGEHEAQEVPHQVQVQIIYCLIYMARRASRFMQ